MLTNNIFTNLQNLFPTLNRPTASTVEVRTGEGRVASQTSNFAQPQNFIYRRMLPIAVSITLLAVSCHLISTSDMTLHIPSAVIGISGLVGLMTQAIASWYRREETAPFPALIPLHGYHQKLSITAPSSPPDFNTCVVSLPAELIDMIQAFCSHDDLLALTSVNKAALVTRFYNPCLQKLCFKNAEDIEQFLFYCQASQNRQAQALILDKGQKTGTWWKSALSLHTTTRFPLFTRERLQEVKKLTLIIPAQSTAKQYNLLFTYLAGIQHLTIYSTGKKPCALGLLLKAAQHLTLHHLAIIYPDSDFFKPGKYLTDYLDIIYPDDDSHKVKDNLPDELWQLTTLKTLTIKGFANIVSISEDIDQLNALRSLTLGYMQKLKTLPKSLGRLDKLEALSLLSLDNITTLPEEIGQLTALKSLTLKSLRELKAWPASLQQLSNLESFTLEGLHAITALPKDINQLKALKSLTLDYVRLNALPASLGKLDKLEALILYDLPITTLPEEIGQLKALKSLELNSLKLIKALPASLGQLNRLEVLFLDNLTSITALPKEIGQLKALKLLYLGFLTALKALPASFGQLDKLEKLIVEYMHAITALPEDIGQLKALKSLGLYCLERLKALPASLEQLHKLETLTLDNLPLITALPKNIGQLRGLKVVNLIRMKHIEMLPGKLAQIVIRE
jgi:Leucine-rich repeat (LRR) protein